MKKKDLKKLIILNIPYVAIGLVATNVGEAFRIASGTNASEKLQSVIFDGCFGTAFSNPLPSFHPVDLLVGLAIGGILKLAVYIKGKNANEGDTLVLTIARGEEKKQQEITVTRAKVEIETITTKMFGGGVGYIRVSQFINSTAKDFEAGIEKLKADGMKGLIIDLRSNPGGYAHTVLDMADMVLPEGTIAYLEDNKGRRQYFTSDAEELGLPMVVLINGGTASAAELLAGSIQAYGLGTLVGEKSFGKAVGQSPLPLTTKSAIYLTNARYYTPKGECIDKEGIEPDVKVELAQELYSRLPLLSLSEDTQLSKAVEIMTEKIGA